MHSKLIVLPLVLLICSSFANANAKTAAASEKEVPALYVAEKDDNLVPASYRIHDEDADEENYDIAADDQPVAEKDEPENDSTELEDESDDAVDASDEKQSHGKADPAFPALTIVNGYVPVKKGNLVTTLSAIPAEYVISFSVRPTAFSSGWSNVLHFTTNGNQGKLGYRIPGVFMVNKKLYVCGSVNGNSNYCYAPTKPFALNKWTDVTISLSKGRSGCSGGSGVSSVFS